MNKNIEKLCKISKKNARLIIGLMSGTSLDGLDVALCSVNGYGTKTKIKVLHFETSSYPDDFKAEIKTIFAKKNIDLEKLCLLHPWIALTHAEIVNNFLKKWKVNKNKVDLIASHGQTIYHAPVSLHKHPKFGNGTLQLGDGDHLSVATGIITISDFRQKHIAGGGEGAPLAAYGDHFIFYKKGEDRILLNIGGIANFTYLPGSKRKEAFFSTDTGPGNTMIDMFVQQNFPGKYFDENATLAKKGKVSEPLLAALKNNIFFSLEFPKTTGPEFFNSTYLKEAKLKADAGNISIEDTIATLTKFSAVTIADAVKKIKQYKKLKIFVSGGGIYNPLMMQHLKNDLAGCSLETTDALGINPDAKEAVLFALLANECVARNNDYHFNTKIKMPLITMGKISFPD